MDASLVAHADQIKTWKKEGVLLAEMLRRLSSERGVKVARADLAAYLDTLLIDGARPLPDGAPTACDRPAAPVMAPELRALLECLARDVAELKTLALEQSAALAVCRAAIEALAGEVREKVASPTPPQDADAQAGRHFRRWLERAGDA